jgi:hypothetical protein
MEMNRVTDVSNPRAMVPPKDENVKMIKPANSTIEVYTMLLPTSMIDELTATGMKYFLVINSCLYLARK